MFTLRENTLFFAKWTRTFELELVLDLFRIIFGLKPLAFSV